MVRFTHFLWIHTDLYPFFWLRPLIQRHRVFTLHMELFKIGVLDVLSSDRVMRALWLFFFNQFICLLYLVVLYTCPRIPQAIFLLKSINFVAIKVWGLNWILWMFTYRTTDIFKCTRRLAGKACILVIKLMINLYKLQIREIWSPLLFLYLICVSTYLSSLQY